MRSGRAEDSRPPLGLGIAADRRRSLFLHAAAAARACSMPSRPRSKSYQFPPPGLTSPLVRRRLGPAGRLAAALALGPGRLGLDARGAGARHARRRRRGAAGFFGRETISLLIILPIALPGIITGIALRSAFMRCSRSRLGFWTIVVGHATFCIVVVYNNAVARFRRTATAR